MPGFDMEEVVYSVGSLAGKNYMDLCIQSPSADQYCLDSHWEVFETGLNTVSGQREFVPWHQRL